ncbi:MAG: hypothetical protein Q3997_04720 [Propionibacteriaceae bacterium]|nr:hypothetical protein [Propionibacteriaceae bacterium]
MEIDWVKINRTARQYENEANMLALTSCSTTDITLLDSLLPDWDNNDQEEPNNGGWFTTPQGPLIFLEGTPHDTTPWINELAHNLTQAGITGTLTGATIATRGRWAKSIEDDLPETCLSLGFQSCPLKARYICEWSTTDPRLPHQLITPGLDWLTEHHADLLQSTGRADFWTNPTTAHTILAERIKNAPTTLTRSYHRDRKEVRSFSLLTPCATELGVVRGDNDWRQRLDTLLEALPRFPLHQLSIGFISHYPFRWHHERNRVWRDHPELWQDYIPAPLGVLIVTAKHLDKANNLTRWTTTQLTPTHYLLQTTNPQPWLDAPTRDSITLDHELLALAQHDLGDMILTPTTAEKLGLDPYPL